MDTEPTPCRRLLIVDDDEVMRELLFALLSSQGDEVHAVESGEEALGWLTGQPAPDVLLTDLQMPGLEGAPLLLAFRKALAGETLLLGMSGSRPGEEVLALLDAFIPKPFSTAELEQAIETASNRRRADAGASSDLPPEASEDDADSGQFAPLDPVIFSALFAKFRPEQLAELYKLTLDDVMQRLGRMTDRAASGDLPAVKREAHAVKGACGFVGARELEWLASTVEGSTTLNTSALARFPAACVRLRRMLDAKFQPQSLPQESPQ